MLVWGLTSKYFQSYITERQGDSTVAPIVVFIVSGSVFWFILYRGQTEIALNTLEDFWDKNLINLFVSPLKFWEWVSAFFIIGIIKAGIGLLFMSALALVLYKVRIFAYGLNLVWFGGLLIMSGWAVGSFVTGLILRFGKKIQSLAWTLVIVLVPFSAVYYPVSALPVWAKHVALTLPTSYIFEGAREVIQTGALDHRKLLWSFGLNILYLTLALVFLRRGFKKALNKGLVKLH
jgi:ABC-2 type transport system permease protein